jgi:hypothetical protein
MILDRCVHLMLSPVSIHVTSEERFSFQRVAETLARDDHCPTDRSKCSPERESDQEQVFLCDAFFLSVG